ncbi:putative exported protein [Vibrio astriarenae]|nr:putative exported protein [Vibrio sp. C7]
MLKKTVRTLALTTALLSSLSFAQALPEQAKLDIQFELPELDVAMYARPYVAIWIENDQGEVVKNIALWTGNQTEWLKDIRSWWRKFGRYNSQKIDGISSATRAAGTYRVDWDGISDSGERADQGEYTLFTEVVREHGGRDIVRQKIELGNDSFTVSTEPQAEVGFIRINYSAK